MYGRADRVDGRCGSSDSFRGHLRGVIISIVSTTVQEGAVRTCSHPLPIAPRKSVASLSESDRVLVFVHVAQVDKSLTPYPDSLRANERSCLPPAFLLQ